MNPKGDFFTMVHYQDQDFVTNLNFFHSNLTEKKNTMEENDVEDENDSDDDDENIIDEGDVITNRNTYLYDVIETGTFVAMRCPTNSLELFFLGVVLSKDVAFIDKMDHNGHCVLKGDKFIEVHYLEKDNEGKHYIQYKRSNQPTSFIHLAEVFACHVELDLELKMKPSEYQSLTMEAL